MIRNGSMTGSVAQESAALARRFGATREPTGAQWGRVVNSRAGRAQ